YAYYHCHRCGDFRARAEEAHAAFEDFVRTLQITPEAAALYRAVAADVTKKDDRTRREEEADLERKLKDLDGRLDKDDEALTDGAIPVDSHRRLKTRYDREALTVRERLSEVRRTDDGTARRMAVAADLFSMLSAVWEAAVSTGNAEAVSDLVGSIAPEKVAFDGEAVRTPFGSLAKAVFGPETQKTGAAEPVKDPASREAV